MDENDFNELVDQVMALGFSEERAAELAARIGDTPELDEAGLVVVRDGAGHIVERLRLRLE